MPTFNTGDKVWFVPKGLKEVCEATVVRIEYDYFTNPQEWLVIDYFSSIVGKQEYKSRIDLMLNKTVFLTREEAERALKNAEPICDYTKTDWNDCCECSAKDYCDKYNERSEIIGDLLGEIKNEGR